jgi:glucose-6-phosphate 1-dehydrogenase
MEERPTILAVFGISGDLSHRYLLPALAEIKKAGQLPPDFKVLGISRREISAKDVFSDKTRLLTSATEFIQMDMANTSDYRRLKDKLEAIASEFKEKPQIIFYFAVPPAAVEAIISHLGAARLNGPSVKLLLEKPFGSDLASARRLVSQTAKCFKEEQVYRIDHYLAKEVAQNLSVFLASNTLFRSVWNKDFIEYIEIVAAEKIGLENRTNFYEQTGALRDFQSHLMQLAALTLMEPCPDLFDFSELPKRRLAALKSLSVTTKNITSSVWRAQYKGYRKEVSNPGSTTETFIALQLHSSDPRWKGVPVYLATGKNLDQKLTQVRVNFKKTSTGEANTLVLRVQPREGIELDLWVKKPGYEKKLEKKILSFSFAQNFEHLPDAYEQVLVDAIRSDHSLFASSQEVLASWAIVQPILDFWQKGVDNLKMYDPGSSVEQVLGMTE